jgi:hypothetical protein
MVDFFQKQPDGSLRGPIDWQLFLGWEGDPEDGIPIYIPVSFANTGAPYTPQVPQAPTLSTVLTSRTTLTATWSAGPSGPAGPAVSLWEVDMQTSSDNSATFGAWAPLSGSPFDADVLSADLVSLPTGTPEIVFRIRVRGINGDGAGPYTQFDAQWGEVAGRQ